MYGKSYGRKSGNFCVRRYAENCAASYVRLRMRARNRSGSAGFFLGSYKIISDTGAVPGKVMVRKNKPGLVNRFILNLVENGRTGTELPSKISLKKAVKQRAIACGLRLLRSKQGIASDARALRSTAGRSAVAEIRYLGNG